MVIPWFSPAIGKPPFYMAKRLVKSGHDVTILTSELDETHKKGMSELEGADTIRLKAFTIFGKIVVPSHLFRLLFLKTDVIYADGLGHPSSFIAALIGKLRRIPVVLRADWGGAPIIRKGLRSIYDKFVKLSTLKRSAKILVFSKTQKEEMSKYGIEHDKIEVVPNGADDKALISETKRTYLKNRLNIPTNAKIILNVGRMVSGKNLELGIRTLSNVNKARIHAVFVIVTYYKKDLEYFKQLSNLIEKLDLKNKVFVLENVNHNDMPKVYASSDVFFLTSKPIEGMNISTIEAMCASVPVVTSKASVTSEIVEEAKCGYIIGGEEDATERMLYLLSHEDERKSLGENGQKYVSENLTWDKLTAKVEEIMITLSRK